MSGNFTVAQDYYHSCYKYLESFRFFSGIIIAFTYISYSHSSIEAFIIENQSEAPTNNEQKQLRGQK